MQPANMPSTAGYWIALILLVVGLAGGIGLIVSGVGDATDAATNLPQPLPLPGTHVVTLQSGDYTVYEEADAYGTFEGGGGQVLDLKIHQRATGEEVALRSPTMSETYEMGERRGRALYTFTAPQAGEYAVAGAYASSPAPAGATTTIIITNISPVRMIGGIMGKIFGGACAGGVLLLVALIVFIVTIVRRGGAKRRLAAQAYPQTPPPMPPTR